MSKSYLRELQKIAKDVRQIKKKVNKIEKKYRNKAAKNFQKKIFPRFQIKNGGAVFLKAA